MAEIKTSDILNASEINKDLQDIIDKFNQLLAAMKQTSGEFQKSTNSTKKMTEADKKAAEEKKQQIAAEKALIAEKKKQLALEQKQAALLEKQAQKQKELIEAATKEVKTLGDLNAKLAARRKLIQGLEMGTDAYNEMAESIAELAKQQDIANSGLGIFNQRVGNYQKAADTVNMSLGEMKKELMELRNMSFANLNPEEITQIRDRMAELTDSIGDFQAQIRTASADRIPALMDGLQGLVAVAQGVTGALAIFGVETEKLDKAMVQLIGVSQALKTIQELQEKGTLRVAWATAKDTAAKAANAVAAKGQAMATTGATAATRALGKAMMANPYLIMAAAAATLISGTIVLIKYLKEQGSIQKEINKVNEAAAKDIGKQKQDLNSLINIAKDHSKSLRERQEAMNKINELSPEYLGNLTLETIGTQGAATAINLYTQEISKKAKAKALESILTEKYIKLEEQYASGAQMQHISDTKDEIAALERKLADLTTTTAVFTNVTAGAQSNLTDLIGTSQIGVPEGTTAKNFDGSPIIYKGGKWVAVVVKSPISGGETKADKINQSYQSYLSNVEKIRKEYETLLPLLKSEDDIKKAAIERDQKIFDAGLDYYGKITPEMQSLIDKYDIIIEDLTKIDSLDNVVPLEQIKEAKTQTQIFLEELQKAHKIIKDGVKTQEDDTYFDKLVASAKKFSEFWAKNGEAIETTLSGISDGISGVYDNQINKQQLAADNNAKYFDNLLENYDQDSAEYQQLLAQKEAAQEQYQARLVELERKKAAFDKVKALIDIAINTAKGIVSALGTTPPNPILAGAIGVAGAVQAGVVASQPLPQYYVGLDSADKDHFGSVAERGAELVNYPDGTSELFTKPTITFIPKYTSIDTAAETAKKLAGAQFTADLTELNNSSRESIKYLGIIARNTQTRQSATDIHYINKYLK